ncbi:patatin-like phospholipase [Variibacter gotjawalensis]|uniref:Patatin-like phospholipase n=1 Tax=Variibacter gotjawalensis TaxID=1333996 RepID=A0A0S3PUX4_9BRAD|nr:patatin-like phospholipase family protein [Variibacter gotjawalensis]NIK50035.1 putative acylesterase/phospholipase RssA [Variibacter gotjawalensis]RZS46034.1 putative acylesterase/phospholipase RssA [Variibacter gotjawalensis]BAT59709.1 patatin-like phospholipase [Variibacter gotjawalensis]
MSSNSFAPSRRGVAALLISGFAIAANPALAAPSRSKKKEAAKVEPKPNLERVAFTEEDQKFAAIPGFPDARFFSDDEAAFTSVTKTAIGAWITLSGGGEDGAYGAGVLSGLTLAGNRPDFSLVVGSSTGALMAPYVFLGASQDEALRTHYTSIHSGEIFELMNTPESLFDTWPLKKLIERSVSADMLTAIAAEHAKGRRLLVTTTNLDAGRMVVWNIGAIASRAKDADMRDAAVQLVRNVLLASSSIPGFFPPVHIDVAAGSKSFSEMHADGSIQSPFFVAPESLLARGSASLAARELYVLVNNKVTAEFGMAERAIHSVLARSITVAMKAGLRGEVMRIGQVAQRQDLPLRLAVVPPSFNVQARGMFDPDYMKALFEHGVAAGRDGQAFGNSAMAALRMASGG